MVDMEDVITLEIAVDTFNELPDRALVAADEHFGDPISLLLTLFEPAPPRARMW
jgi:hypothetical protein